MKPTKRVDKLSGGARNPPVKFVENRKILDFFEILALRPRWNAVGALKWIFMIFENFGALVRKIGDRNRKSASYNL